MTNAQVSAPGRVRRWFTVQHLAQASLILQQIILIRSAFEFLRLGGALNAEAVAVAGPLFIAMGATAALALVSLGFYFARHGLPVIVLTVLGIAGLVAYKLVAMPQLG